MSRERSEFSNPYGGIECPECGSIDLRVVETRRGDKVTHRRRECDRRHRFDTVEMVADAVDEKLPATTPDDAATAPLLIHDLLDARNIVQVMDRALDAIIKKAKGEE